MVVSVVKIAAAVVIGAGIGGMIGRTRSCESGGCPLTANPRRGALYGGFMGLLIGFAFLNPAGGPTIDADAGIAELTTTSEFNKRLEETEGPVVAYFHAPWCGVCRRVGPQVNELARNHGDAAEFVAVNTDQAPELAQKYAVRYLPTSIVFRNRTEQARFVGPFDNAQVLEHIQRDKTASRMPLPPR